MTSKSNNSKTTSKTTSKSNKSDPKIVGYGTYGCVTKPMIPCSNAKDETKIDKSKPTVSKVMYNEDALGELKEMEKIGKFEGIQKYIIKVPTLCRPKDTDQFQKVVDKCTGLSEQFYVNKSKGVSDNELRLLQMEDGGINVEDFVDKLLKHQSYEDKAIFFTSICNLFDGLQFFRDHNIMHFDVKNKNIVYNVKTGIIKFIDFGLATTFTKFKKECKKNNSEYSISHHYFPSETSCTNSEDYHRQIKCSRYRLIYGRNYNKFLNDAARTFDSYELTFGFKEMFQALIKTHKYYFNDINVRFFTDCFVLMSKYCDKNVHKREHDLRALNAQYTELLKKYNLYSVSTPTPSMETIKRSRELSHTVLEMSKSPKDSPLKKESSNKSSLKKESSKYSFNKTNKRVRFSIETESTQPNKKTKKARKLKNCPPGKIRNSVTKRCIKRPKIKVQTNKLKSTKKIN